MCDTFDGKVDTLNYKTIRYPGHGKLMRFLLYELIMKKDLKQLEAILTNAKPPVDDDLVHVYAVVEGKINTKISRKEYFKTYFPKKTGNRISHVRPHARNADDTHELPIADKLTGLTEFTKHCFWLNASYVKDEIYEK